MSNKKYNTIDLFAGCGGLLDGFMQEGTYNTLACVEWDKYPCLTLKKRLETRWKHTNAEHEVIRFDIQRTEELINGFNDSEFGEHIGLDALTEGKKVDVIIGGPPCQAYSLAGRIRDPQGMRDDYRNYLFESYINKNSKKIGLSLRQKTIAIIEDKRFKHKDIIFTNTGIILTRPIYLKAEVRYTDIDWYDNSNTSLNINDKSHLYMPYNNLLIHLDNTSIYNRFE